MPSVIIIDDNFEYVKYMVEAITQVGSPFDDTDVEGWWIYGIDGDLEQDSEFPSNVYAIGFADAIKKIGNTDAKLLITDLDFEQDIQNYMNEASITEEISELAIKVRVQPNAFGGLLVIHNYLNDNDTDKFVLVFSDFYGPPVENFLKKYTERFSGSQRRIDLVEEIEKIYSVDIDAKIWPAYTDDWYDKDTHGVPHNNNVFEISERDNEEEKEIKKSRRKSVNTQILRYLRGLLGDELPETWLESNYRFYFFWEDLRHLIGVGAICSGEEGKKPLTLGNVVLLLAVASKKITGKRPVWFDEIKWDTCPRFAEILPQSQTRDQAVEAVKALISGDGKGLFESIQTHEGTQNSLIQNVLFIRSGLYIRLGFDVTNRDSSKSERPSMLEKFKKFDVPGDGHLYEAFIMFLRASAVCERGYDPECTVKLVYKDKYQASEFAIRTLRP